MKRVLVFLVLLSSGFLSAQSQKPSKAFKNLVEIMQGHYTSELQSKKDSTYFNISLRMTPIWKSKGAFLYVEQAMASKQDKPYRVRIYKLSERPDGKIVSEIYTLKDEKAWIGKYTDPTLFDALSEADLELKSGCEVVLERVSKNTFRGSTGEKSCPSELRGASYATSKVTVTKNSILSWDQGFDAAGKQVWGAEKGGYEFLKVN
ncbi:chromophore lyase CpcT/CpeT [Flavobacterium sp.]|uniref:chromophore lyase CpcT/CpeT n=1 Tax=Flavobacterium sp. TaxID=239 RepID=UPI0026286F54|nr:chromophore lyase CpcT/CpeT [Flavobacterium sp.]